MRQKTDKFWTAWFLLMSNFLSYIFCFFSCRSYIFLVKILSLFNFQYLRHIICSVFILGKWFYMYMLKNSTKQQNFSCCICLYLRLYIKWWDEISVFRSVMILMENAWATCCFYTYHLKWTWLLFESIYLPLDEHSDV